MGDTLRAQSRSEALRTAGMLGLVAAGFGAEAYVAIWSSAVPVQACAECAARPQYFVTADRLRNPSVYRLQCVLAESDLCAVEQQYNRVELRLHASLGAWKVFRAHCIRRWRFSACSSLLPSRPDARCTCSSSP